MRTAVPPPPARGHERQPSRVSVRAVALAAVTLLTGLAACSPTSPGAAEVTTAAVGDSRPAAVMPAHDLTRADVDAWLDETIPDALADADIAGASIAVVHHGEVVSTRGYGQADVDAGIPVDPERTLFRVGSVSKLVTATAVLQLVERGQVDLDTDVEQYTGPGLDLEQPVTLRHLLTHTAGFEERVAGLISLDGTQPDLRASLVTDPPEQVYLPGTMPAYSNYGNALAGYVVEAVSGQHFEDYVQQNILEPAGMSSSSFLQPLPAGLADRVALGYPTADADPLPFETVGQPPAGALSATADDMARFMLAHLGTPVDGRQLLAAPTRTLMQQPALGEAELGALAAGPRMGLGWFDESRNGHRVVGHGGDTQVFHSHLQLWPDEATGLYFSVNSTGTDGAAHLLRDEVLDSFADRYFPAGPAPAAHGVDAATRAGHAAALAGSYESTRGFHSTFLTALGPLQPTRARVVAGDRVLFTPGPGQLTPAEYEEIAPWVFRQVDGHRLLAVDADERGVVRAIGHDSAMSMVPVDGVRAAVGPAFAGAVAALALGLLAWPVGALLRRIRGRRRADTAAALAPRAVRTARLLTRLAALSAVLAAAGWVGVVLAVMSLQPVPDVLIRVVQLLTALGVAGVLAAGWRVVAESLARTGWARVTGAVAVLAAFAVLSWTAGELLLLSPDISY